MMKYGPTALESEAVSDIGNIPKLTDSQDIIWIDVQGFGNQQLLEQLAEHFQLHPLAFEDLINVPQVPKSESYGEQQLIVVKVAMINDSSEFEFSQIGIILGPRFVLTFRPEYSDILVPVCKRLELASSRLRQNPADYLAYVVLDTAVDSYYPVLDVLGNSLDSLEDQTLTDPRPELLFEINRMKNQLSNLRRGIWPQRESLQSLIRGDSEAISEMVSLFLRDTADHCVQATDVIEMYHDRSSGLLNTYLSAVSHRSNEIMKFLTVMSSIFVPLTFVAGIYGMNFPDMPEFSLPSAYYLFWVLIIVIAVSMFWFFMRSGWIRPWFLKRPDTMAPADRSGLACRPKLNMDDTNLKYYRSKRQSRRAA
jgi:magnesium transporter